MPEGEEERTEALRSLSGCVVCFSMSSSKLSEEA